MPHSPGDVMRANLRQSIKDAEEDDKDLAARAHLDPGNVSKWLSGEIDDPKLSTIDKLARAAHLSLAELFTPIGHAPPLPRIAKMPAAPPIRWACPHCGARFVTTMESETETEGERAAPAEILEPVGV